MINYEPVFMRILKAFLLVILLLPNTGFSIELPDDSIYHIESNWIDQDNRALVIGDFKGTVQVVSFVYTYCEHSCPVIISKLKELDALLPNELKNQVNFLLISLDPSRDTPSVLNTYMDSRNLNKTRWSMLNGDPNDVLEMSALMGVRYRPMDAEGQDIAHSNMITVLDQEGRIQYQMKGMNENLNDVLHTIEGILTGNTDNSD